MRYFSVLLTILVVWTSAIAIAIVTNDTNTRFQLFALLMIFSPVVFAIGFRKAS